MTRRGERMPETEDTPPEEMLPAERRQRLMEWFDVNFAGSSQDLARKFNISVSTIRRDLDLLSHEGFLRRTHGGAVRIRQHTTYEPSTDLARRTAVEEKSAIVKEAIALIEPDQSLLVDTGAIAHDLADAIAALEFPLTVITNDLYVAKKLTYKPQLKLVVPGGTNRPGAFSLLGEPGTAFLQAIRCDLYFMSAQAIDGECASDTVLQLVELKRAMIEAAQTTILLAESSRFSARALYRIAPVEQIDMIITDEGLPAEDRDRVADQGVEVRCVTI